jgi:hypothetical protein
MVVNDRVKSELEACVSALQASLGKAAEQFPQDVVAAAISAAGMRKAFGALAEPTAEPWPAMRMRSPKCIG